MKAIFLLLWGVDMTQKFKVIVNKLIIIKLNRLVIR